MVLHFGMSRGMDVLINIEHNGKIMKLCDESKISCSVLHCYLEGGVTKICVNFYCCTVHFDICRVHSPTNAHFNFKKRIKIYINL